MDTSFYIVIRKETIWVLVFYVDEIFISGNSEQEIENVIRLILRQFEVRLEEHFGKYLGISIHDCDRSVKIHYCSLIDRKLYQFLTKDCWLTKTPFPPWKYLSETQYGLYIPKENETDNRPYQKLVGRLLHLSNTTRPYIFYRDRYLYLFMKRPRTVLCN